MRGLLALSFSPLIQKFLSHRLWNSDEGQGGRGGQDKFHHSQNLNPPVHMKALAYATRDHKDKTEMPDNTDVNKRNGQ